MNDRFPGLPDYVGPTSGWFHAVHHSRNIIEWSDGINERVEYIRANKPPNEINIRLANLMYVGDWGGIDDYKAKRKALCDDYWAKFKALDDDHRAKRKALCDDYEVKLKPLDDDHRANPNHLYHP